MKITRFPNGYHVLAIEAMSLLPNGMLILPGETLRCWSGDEVGIPADTAARDVIPMEHPNQKKWKTVSAGGFRSVGIDEDGKLWAYGSNEFGQLGTGTGKIDKMPVQVEPSATWVYADAGWDYTVAVKTDGSLWSWGSNLHGQLGNGTVSECNSPVQVEPGSTWKSVSVFEYHTVAIRKDGSLWTWGKHRGVGTSGTGPVQIGSDTDWVLPFAGMHSNLAIKATKRHGSGLETGRAAMPPENCSK